MIQLIKLAFTTVFKNVHLCDFSYLINIYGNYNKGDSIYFKLIVFVPVDSAPDVANAVFKPVSLTISRNEETPG